MKRAAVMSPALLWLIFAVILVIIGIYLITFGRESTSEIVAAISDVFRFGG